MEPKKYKIEEYGLRFIKEKIAAYRRESSWIMGVLVSLPVEAETSIFFLQQHYPTSRVMFELTTDLNFGEILIERQKAKIPA